MWLLFKDVFYVLMVCVLIGLDSLTNQQISRTRDGKRLKETVRGTAS